MKVSLENLQDYFKQLRLTEPSEKGRTSILDISRIRSGNRFIGVKKAYEEKSIEKYRKKAKFPYLKILKDFDL